MTGFQRELVKSIIRRDQHDEDLSGQRLKGDLSAVYGKEIGNSRIYQNLSALVDLGLVEIEAVTERRNRYGPTKHCLELARREAQTWVGILEVARLAE